MVLLSTHILRYIVNTQLPVHSRACALYTAGNGCQWLDEEGSHLR